MDLGQVLNLVGGSTLTTGYSYSSAIALEGTDLVEAVIAATFANGTGATSMEADFEVSEDGSVWVPIAAIQGSKAIVLSELSMAIPGASGVVRERYTTTDHRTSKYLRVGGKSTGAAIVGDSLTVQLKVGQSLMGSLL